MSLIGALNIGKSALATQQAALQVTGNNIANVGNPNYTRQTVATQPSADHEVQPGMFVGTGINLTGIYRQIDEALAGRLRSSISDSESADTMQQWMGRIESVFNELTDSDLSTQLSTFFNSWSNLANNPQDSGLRQIVIQSGQTVASWFNDLSNQLGALQQDADTRLNTLVNNANQLADQVADLNQQIALAEGGGQGQANGLRDQRDTILSQLSQLMDIRIINQPNGLVDVYVGSQPLISGVNNRGVYLQQTSIEGQPADTVRVKADNAELKVSSGQIGAVSKVCSDVLGAVSDQINELASNLIFELNKLHSQGQGLDGFTATQSTNLVDDPAVALNDPASGLAFAPANGSFVVHLTQSETGLSSSTLMQVDLDGLNGNDMSLNDLATQFNNISGITATVVGGQLRLATNSPNVTISFSQDSSGVLAALGINSFFTGKNAMDMGVNATLIQDPSLLAAAANGNSGDNQTARAIADLQTQSIKSLKGQTLSANYDALINSIAVQTSSAGTNAEAARTVRQTLESQRESLSGVSLDEEAMNLMKQQRAFQAASRLIATIDDLMKTVIQLV